MSARNEIRGQIFHHTVNWICSWQSEVGLVDFLQSIVVLYTLTIGLNLLPTSIPGSLFLVSLAVEEREKGDRVWDLTFILSYIFVILSKKQRIQVKLFVLYSFTSRVIILRISINIVSIVLLVIHYWLKFCAEYLICFTMQYFSLSIRFSLETATDIRSCTTIL